MLKISQSEGFVFDLLSICEVKIANSTGSIKEKNVANFQLLAREIQDQIGHFKYEEIVDSDEYFALYEVNSALFNLVDQAKTDTGLAKKTDAEVYNRYLKKEALQKKFFDTELSEIKMGYQ